MPYLRPDGKTQVTVRYENGKPIEIVKILISTQHKPDVDGETLIKPDLWEHVVEPILPTELYDEKKLREGEPPRQPDRQVRDRRADGRLRPHRPQDHRRHLRRRRPPRRRRVLRQGPVEGGPLGRLRGALRGEERRRGRARRPLRGAGRLRDRRRAPAVADGRDLRHRADRAVEDRGAGREALRPAPGRVPPVPRPAPADLPQDGGLRPLRPRGPRLHVGEDGQGRRAARRRRPGRARGRFPERPGSPRP